MLVEISQCFWVFQNAKIMLILGLMLFQKVQCFLDLQNASFTKISIEIC